MISMQTMSNHDHSLGSRRLQLSAATSLLLVISAIFCREIFAEDVPPQTEIVSGQFNALWRDRKFEQFEAYTDGLRQKHPNYLPSIIADLIRQERRGAQVEVYVRGMSELQKRLQDIPEAIGPGFMDALTDEIKEHEGILKVYLERGLSPEDRLRMFAPPRVHTGDADLIPTILQFAPAIVLPTGGNGDVRDLREDFAKTYDFSKYTADVLRDAMDDTTAPQAATLAAAKQFKKLMGGRALTSLLEIIAEGRRGQAESAAMVMSDFGAEAVPPLLKVLVDGKTTSPIENAAFALARIGVSTPEVLDALKLRMAEPYYLPYVESVVTYLENKNKK